MLTSLKQVMNFHCKSYNYGRKKVKISGIIMNDSQKLIVCGLDKARELLGWQDGTYNGLLSVKPLELGDEISKTVTCEDIKEQMQTIYGNVINYIFTCRNRSNYMYCITLCFGKYAYFRKSSQHIHA